MGCKSASPRPRPQTVRLPPGRGQRGKPNPGLPVMPRALPPAATATTRKTAMRNPFAMFVYDLARAIALQLVRQIFFPVAQWVVRKVLGVSAAFGRPAWMVLHAPCMSTPIAKSFLSRLARRARPTVYPS